LAEEFGLKPVVSEIAQGQVKVLVWVELLVLLLVSLLAFVLAEELCEALVWVELSALLLAEEFGLKPVVSEMAKGLRWTS